jgi:hypothetical protein
LSDALERSVSDFINAFKKGEDMDNPLKDEGTVVAPINEPTPSVADNADPKHVLNKNLPAPDLVAASNIQILEQPERIEALEDFDNDNLDHLAFSKGQRIVISAKLPDGLTGIAFNDSTNQVGLVALNIRHIKLGYDFDGTKLWYSNESYKQLHPQYISWERRHYIRVFKWFVSFPGKTSGLGYNIATGAIGHFSVPTATLKMKDFGLAG